MRAPSFLRLPPLSASRRVLAAGTALALAVLVSTLALMWRELGSMAERDRQRLTLLASVMEAHAGQVFGFSGLMLDDLASKLALESPTVAQFEAQLSNHLQGLPLLRGIALVNAQGLVLASTSAADKGARIDLRGLAPPEPEGDHVAIGPWVPGRSLGELGQRGQASADQGFIPLVRPVQLTAQSTVLLVGLVNPDALASYQQQLLDADTSGARILLVRGDGHVLAHVGPGAGAPGASLREHPRFHAFQGATRGSFGPLRVREDLTLGAWHRLDAYPLTALVEQPYATTTARWLRALRGPLLFMALATVLIGLMTRSAWRNARAREAAQRKLDEIRKATAQREQELSILFKSVKELIFRTDAQGVIRFVNPRWRQLTGQAPAAARGRRLSDIVEPQSSVAVAALFQTGGSSGWRRSKACLRGANGKTQVLEITVMPLTGRDGQPYGYAGSAVDITALDYAQKKLQHQLALTERVLESNPLPMCLTDMQGRLVTVNAAWEDFMGVPRSQALGRLNRDILPAAQAQAYDARTEQLLREGGTVRYEERLPRADGSMRDVQITKVLLQSAQGEPMGVLVNKLDITDFLAARYKAQEASRTKSEFVANISHELRTPLQSILGFSELGMVRARQYEKYAAMFQDIHAAGQRMLGLVNDLLDISKIESTVGAFHFARNDVRDLLEDVAAELQMLLERKGLSLRLDLGRVPLVSKVDSTRFAQVVRNVLSNAVKFSPEGSTIEIGASTPDESTILVQVRDHGPGIPPAELEAVFDAFVQSSKTRDESGGTGLGLAICRKIVTAHGGHIHATNAPDGGTIFHITLPTARYTDTMPSPLE